MYFQNYRNSIDNYLKLRITINADSNFKEALNLLQENSLFMNVHEKKQRAFYKLLLKTEMIYETK